MLISGLLLSSTSLKVMSRHFDHQYIAVFYRIIKGIAKNADSNCPLEDLIPPNDTVKWCN
jgi:hypothetical protein